MMRTFAQYANFSEYFPPWPLWQRCTFFELFSLQHVNHEFAKSRIMHLRRAKSSFFRGMVYLLKEKRRVEINSLVNDWFYHQLAAVYKIACSKLKVSFKQGQIRSSDHETKKKHHYEHEYLRTRISTWYDHT